VGIAARKAGGCERATDPAQDVPSTE
jgi:hypothetical protein